MKQCIFILAFLSLSTFGFAGTITGVIRNTEDGKPRVVSIPLEDGQEVPTQEQIAEALTPRREHRKLHLAEMLSYLTVCLDFYDQGKATGFFYSIPLPDNPSLHLPVIVSNRHATENASRTSFVLTLVSNSNDLPTTNSISVTIDNRENPWIHHPDPRIDLSVLPIGRKLNELEFHGLIPFIAPMNSSFIPDDDYMQSITQTDDVIMIGYPAGLRDEVNNQPIFRKGILATSPSKNFGGERKFLVDMAVYPGSSGSPVLLFSETAYLARGLEQPGLHFDGRLKLIGINAATYQSTVTGQVIPVPIPTVVEERHVSALETTEGGSSDSQRIWVGLTNVPNSIGIIIHASCLKEMEAYVRNCVLGVVRGE